jgi:hypothetical protein
MAVFDRNGEAIELKGTSDLTGLPGLPYIML